MIHEAAFFDLDNTITSVPSEQDFVLYLKKQGYVSLRETGHILWIYLKYNLNLINDYHTMKSRLMQKFIGNRNTDEIKTLFAELFTKKLKHALHTDIVNEIEHHRKHNRKIIVISSTLDFIVEAFCAQLHIDQYYCTKLETKNDRYTGKITGMIHYGMTKKIALEEFARAQNIDLENSYAYGDHYSDRYMLKKVGNPVAVNPDKKLRKVAIQNKWQIKEIK